MRDMTDRERFRATMHFKRPDRLPFCEWLDFDYEVIIRWCKEGMPISSINTSKDWFVRGSPSCTGLRPRFFGFDIIARTALNLDQGPISRFVSRTIEETDRYRVFISTDGITQRVLTDHQFYSMPQFLDWPVKTLNDWRMLKPRFDPTDPRRYPNNWGDELIEYYESVNYPIGMRIIGFFNFGRLLMGTVPFVTAFYRNPELVREMMDFWADFLIECTRQAVETLKSNVDFVYFSGEDLAYKHGPHVSPWLFREFMLPNYKKFTSFLRHNRIDVILVDTDGDIRPLIPLFLEGGVNGLYPLEVTAGMDAVALRREYGERLLLIGNIDKRALVKGKAAIEREVESKLPYLKEMGGYIPSLDHLVPPDIPYKNYLHYISVLKKFL